MKFIIKKQLLYSLIIPYVLIVGVTISGYTYIYNISMEQIRDNYIEISSIALNNMVREIDYGMKDIINLSRDIGASPQVRKLAGIELPMDGQDRYDIAMATKEMGAFKQYNNFIEDYYVYFKEGDFIVSSTYYYEPEVAYKEFYKKTNGTYEEWKNELVGNYPMGQVRLIGGKLAYIVTPLLGSGCNIVMLLDTNRLDLLIEDYEKIQQANVYITNQEGDLLLEDRLPVDSYQKHLDWVLNKQESKGHQEVKIGWEDYMTIRETSKEVDFNYHVLIPKRVFAYQTRHILTLLSIMIVIFVSLLWVGLVLIRKNYTNIIGIIKKFNMNKPNEIVYSEVGCIENILDTLQTNIHDQEEIVVENIIRRALNGIVGEDIDRYFKYCSDTLFSNHFVVGVIEPLGKEDINGKEKQFDEFVLHNVISEILKGYAKIYVITFNNSYAVVIDLGQEVEEEGMDYLLDALGRSKKFLAEHMDFKCTLSVSGIYTGIKRLYLAYQEAKRGIEYKIILGSKKIIYCTELYEQGESYHYSMEMELQLINYIKSGELHRALVTIDYLFEINFAENSLSIESTKCFIIDLYSTLVKIAKEINVTIALMPSELLKQIGTIEEMKVIIEDVVQMMCEVAEQKKNIATGAKGNQIIEYIHEHYTDINLNVASIAETFGFNSSYLSRLFKEQTGGNLLTYINRYRIQKVKELLTETDLTLNEIAERVGFINSIAIIRTFKKYEGMTPIQYHS